MNSSSTMIAKSALALMIASLTMGNQSCNQPVERVLKMDVEIGVMAAKPVRLPTGEFVDFPYVVNSLFYREVMNNDHFVISNAVPSPQSAVTTMVLKAGNVYGKAEAAQAKAYLDTISVKDTRALTAYGFMEGLQKQAAAMLQPQSGMQQQSGASQKASDSAATLPACLYDLPQARMGGSVISFELQGGGGISIGYNTGGSIISSVGGSVDFTTSKLELGLKTDDPLTTNTIVIADGVSNQSNVKFGVNFGAAAPFGINFFMTTPLADVIRAAMDKGLVAIVDQYKTMLSPKKIWDEVWESRVLYDPVISDNDTHIAFRGGYRAGVQAGDTFTVTNLHYMWQSAPCTSQLKYKVPLTATPIAELEVVSVGDNVSVAVVKKYLIEQKIVPGAMVKILALKKPPTKK